MRRASLDLYHAATVAADALAEGWGGGGVAVALAWSTPSRLEVLYCRGLHEDVCHALNTGAGRELVDSLQRRGEPAILHADRLDEEAAALRQALDAGEIAGLLLVPTPAAPGVAGILCLELTGAQLKRADGDGPVALAVVEQVRDALRGLSLSAAGAALAVVLAEAGSPGAPGVDGVVVLDRWDRVVFSHGLPDALDGWQGGAFGRSVETLPGGALLRGVEPSATGDLSWEEHLLPSGAHLDVPVSLAAVPFAGRGDDDPGRMILFRDLSAEAEGSGLMPLLGLALRVSSDLEVLGAYRGASHAGDACPMIRRLDDFRALVLQHTRELERRVQEAVGRSAVQGAEVDLHGLVEGALRVRERDILGESIRVLRFLRPELSLVPGDPVKVQAVVSSMVDHARASLRPCGGTLTVRTWEEDGQVYLSVSDDGRGTVPVRNLNAFVPLRPLSGQDRRDEEFLEWARAVVEPWEGRVLVERRPGLWNRVTLMLPGSGKAAEARPGLPTAVSVQRGEEGLEVLVVDDNPSLRSVVRRYLERRGHRVMEAPDGGVALDLLRDRGFDRVVVDICMPGTDGPAFFQSLDSVAPELRERTIFMTGGFVEAGVEDFILATGRPAIRKPFDLDQMARAVED